MDTFTDLLFCSPAQSHGAILDSFWTVRVLWFPFLRLNYLAEGATPDLPVPYPWLARSESESMGITVIKGKKTGSP